VKQRQLYKERLWFIWAGKFESVRVPFSKICFVKASFLDVFIARSSAAVGHFMVIGKIAARQFIEVFANQEKIRYLRPLTSSFSP